MRCACTLKPKHENASSPTIRLRPEPADQAVQAIISAADPEQAVVCPRTHRIHGDLMEYAAFVFGILGLVAFVRVEKLVKTLKEQGVLDQDYKEE